MLDRHARLMRAGALHYAAAGFEIFPLQVGGKRPYQGTHGELDATQSLELVERIWTELPGSNIGWALRYHPGAFVLDVDERSGGAEWLARRPELPHTVRVLTPSRGLGGHYWFRTPEALANVKCAGLSDEWVNGYGEQLSVDHVDIKGIQNGYVILPPSHAGSSGYHYDATARFGEAPIAECPEWLADEILSQSESTTPRVDHVASVDAESFLLGAIFVELGLLGAELRPGAWHALCPNREQHTGKPRKFGGDVILFAPPPGRGGPGYAYCAHSHCRELTAMMLGKVAA